jgi:hypothetical protein
MSIATGDASTRAATEPVTEVTLDVDLRHPGVTRFLRMHIIVAREILVTAGVRPARLAARFFSFSARDSLSDPLRR